LERIEQTAATVRAQVFNRATESAQEIEADALIGADGLHLTVRAPLHPDQGSLLWSGVRMWRGVTEGEPFLSGRSMIIVGSASTPGGTSRSGIHRRRH
jgi:2-polyprenyl-6-methoxyphenol hydroxylase-like FAD-dependent oxidoreductase